MTPLLLAAAGVVALVAAAVLLRGFGTRYRVGRLLAATPRVTIAEAIAIAASGQARYVRVDGRIDGEDEFEDADHRPLVFRRTRIETRPGRSWTTVEDDRQAVPFRVREGLDEIAVDGDALGEGLIVVPRMSLGTAADAPDRVPEGTPSRTPVRARIEQVSSVEHAIVLGVPRPGATPDGPAVVGAGLGRPLVLSTLEGPEAMRILAGERGATRARLVAVCLAIGLGLVVLAGAWLVVDLVLPGIVATAHAATPATEPTQPPLAGDPRSEGDGPGLVGEPLVAILVVIAVAVVAVVAATAWIRLTGGPASDRGQRG